MKKNKIYLTLLPFVLSVPFISGCSSNETAEGPIYPYVDPGEPAEPEVPVNNILRCDGYEYIRYKGGAKIVNYLGENTELVKIPRTLNGLDVHAIASGAFTHKKDNLRKYLDEDTEEEIVETEEECTTYSIGDNVVEIEDGAFEDSSTFFTELEEKPEGWEDEAMTGSALDEEGNIYFETEEEDVSLFEGSVYLYDSLEDAYYLARCLSKEKNVVIPSHYEGKPVVNVGSLSFNLNSYIERVEFPETIGYIKKEAFKGCSNLKELVFNCPNLGAIRMEAFCDCSSLDVVHLPTRLSHLASRTFKNCGTISEIYVPSTVLTVQVGVFENTVVKKIIFQGTEEQWNSAINHYPGVADEYADIEVVFSNETQTIELYKVEDTKNVAVGTNVILHGVLGGFLGQSGKKDLGHRRAKYALITDVDTGYSLILYNEDGLKDQYQPENVGRKIIAKGYMTTYFGSSELASAVIEYEEDETIYPITPVSFDWSEENIDYSSRENYITHYEGQYLGRPEGDGHRFEGLPFYFYSLNVNSTNPELKAGDYVSFNYIIIRYNQLYEGIVDLDTLEYIER